jgi:small membrane protein
MIPIQIFLVLFLAIAFLLYWKLFQNRFLNRIILVTSFLVTIFFVFYPGVSTRIANWLGVGRGTDLILYLSLIFMVFVLLLMYSKIKKLEEMITTLIREKALNESRNANTE